MHSRHHRTLAALFTLPTPASVRYTDVVALLRALDAVIDEALEGSRVRVLLGGAVHVFHNPHPGSELKRYQVRDLRDFLAALGFTPETGD